MNQIDELKCEYILLLKESQPAAAADHVVTDGRVVDMSENGI